MEGELCCGYPRWAPRLPNLALVVGEGWAFASSAAQRGQPWEWTPCAWSWLRLYGWYLLVPSSGEVTPLGVMPFVYA